MHVGHSARPFSHPGSLKTSARRVPTCLYCSHVVHKAPRCWCPLHRRRCLIGAPGVASDYVHHPVSRAFMAELRLGCTGWVETVVPFFCRIGALSNHAATFNPRRFVNPTTYIGWRSGLRIALVERSLQGVHTVVSALIRSTFPVSIPHAVDSLSFTEW